MVSRMGFDLKPRNKNHPWFSMGVFVWSWLLNEGVGLVIGTMSGMEPCEYYFTPRKGLDPNLNDGFRVTAIEARCMAAAARTLVAGYKQIEKEWSTLTEAEREEQYRYANTPRIYKYRPPVKKSFLEIAQQFADWAEKSGGFTIR
jgi:hypothetical protein